MESKKTSISRSTARPPESRPGWALSSKVIDSAPPMCLHATRGNSSWGMSQHRDVCAGQERGMTPARARSEYRPPLLPIGPSPCTCTARKPRTLSLSSWWKGTHRRQPSRHRALLPAQGFPGWVGRTNKGDLCIGPPNREPRCLGCC